MPETTAQPLLVTGASGFVGAALCRYFAAKGRRVVAVHRPSRSRWRLEAGARGAIESLDIDLTSPPAVRAALAELRPSIILNCAAYGAYSQQTDPARIYQVNFDAVRTLIDAASTIDGFTAFVQAGSSSEYGLHCTAPREDGPTVPDSDYAVSKVAATAYVQFAGTKKVPAWCLRLYSVYGPYEDASRLVPKLLGRGAAGGYPNLVNPDISRDFVHVDDVCAAFDAVIAKSAALPRGEVFNVGSGQKTTLGDIVGRVQKLFSIPAEPQWGSMANRHWDHRDWYSNPAKAAALLGWRATTSLDDGLAKTAHWMAENPAALQAAEAHVATGATP